MIALVTTLITSLSITPMTAAGILLAIVMLGLYIAILAGLVFWATAVFVEIAKAVSMRRPSGWLIVLLIGPLLMAVGLGPVGIGLIGLAYYHLAHRGWSLDWCASNPDRESALLRIANRQQTAKSALVVRATRRTPRR